MAEKKVADLVHRAAAVLSANHRDGYTIPSGRLYPFQWNWDAGFHALGWMYINEAYAFSEISSMFKGQWKNGMLPHIVFHRENDAYFPGPSEWDIHTSEHAPTIATSGITQLPVFGFMLERMVEWTSQPSPGMKAFLAEIYPKVLAWHRYLYTNRDPYHEGIVYIHHNWESTDNSPAWDRALERIDIKQAREVSHLRKDISAVDESHRPTHDNYKRYIYLVDLLKANGYNDSAISAHHPFLIQDTLFNALLVKSNKGLLKIGKLLGENVDEIQEWIEKATTGINNKLWDETTGMYYSYDLRNEQRIPVKTSSGLIPLFAGICSPEQAKRLCRHIVQNFVPDDGWMLCPSTAVTESSFDPQKYWRGPVWANVNWMLYHGAMHYGEAALAERIKHNTFELIHRHGFFEYFDPRPEKNEGNAGLGADDFSWTAAVYLDWVFNEKIL